MLDPNALKEDILSAINGMTDAAQTQLLTSQTIANYLLANLQITCNYSGMLPSVPPLVDPMSGTKIFKLQQLIINDSMQVAASSGGINAWYAMFITQIMSSSLINTKDQNNTVSLPIAFPLFTAMMPTILDLTAPNQLQTNWGKITTALINDIKSASLLPTATTTSMAGGVGATIILNII